MLLLALFFQLVASSIILMSRSEQGHVVVYGSMPNGQDSYRLPTDPQVAAHVDPIYTIHRFTNFQLAHPVVVSFVIGTFTYHIVYDAANAVLPFPGAPKPGCQQHLWIPLHMLVNGEFGTLAKTHSSLKHFYKNDFFKQAVLSIFGPGAFDAPQ